MPSSCGMERYRLLTSIVHKRVSLVIGVELRIFNNSSVFFK